jgi:SpoVK/Ycf46/Vps4 family AAA+-type ATPase
MFFILCVIRIMLIMQKANRLINDFRKQTKTTIWKHLDAMAVNYAVYSTHLNGLSPFLTDYDVYVYCDSTNVVILCLDCCGHNDENIYAESDTLSSLIFSKGREPRLSTVRKLAEAVRLATVHLQSSHPDIAVYGVLLTEAEILNTYELYELWKSNNIMVIDECNRLKYRQIRVNDDDELACKDYIKTIIDATPDMAETEATATLEADNNSRNEDLQDEDDCFAKLIDKYLNEAMGIVDNYDSSVNDAAQTEEAGKDEDEELTSEETPEDTYDDDDVSFPDGEIEQNHNISIKVEILRPIPNPREELEKLVGCSDIKRRMDELVALTRYNKMMKEVFPNGKPHNVSLHSIFLGHPGTGKTTVCKIYGSLLRQAGALSKGHVVVCDRSTFIGTLWGDEERSMKQVLEMAKGGVLMVDEAYLLNGKHENDPGKLVIQLLMNILADETQRDIAVVLCGYKEPMMKLLDTNPGLQSRFPNKFEFTDFTVDELLEITKRRIKDYDYQFTDPAWEKYSGILEQAYQVRNPETWGNARFIANQLERIYIQHASRCVRQQPKDKSELLMLTPEDIVPIEIPRQKTRIGF